MKHHRPHWFAQLLASAIGVALITMLTLLVAAFFRHVFDFDIFANYAALLMVCMTLIVLAAPLLLSAYQKWTQRQTRPMHTRKTLLHR